MALNNDLFIREVKKRPALYNPAVKEYTDKNFKKRLWFEIGPMFIVNWSQLNNTEKCFKAKELQSRWHNLRTCFNREYKKELREELLEGPSGINKRRRRYIYYDELSFLRNFHAPKRSVPETDCNYYEATSSDIDAEMQNKSVDVPPSTERSDNSTPTEPIDLPNIKSETYDLPSMEASNETRNDFDEEIDEDKYFLLSLVPAFRRFNEDQKYAARIEIMHVMRRINSSGNI